MRKIIDQYTDKYSPSRCWQLRHKEQRASYEAKYRKANRERYLNLNTKYYRKRREELNRIKCNPCSDCGVQYSPWVMQFDHREPSKKTFAVSQINLGYTRLKNEIAKCDLVCANCHAERTHKQRLKGLIKYYTGSKGLTCGK